MSRDYTEARQRVYKMTETDGNTPPDYWSYWEWPIFMKMRAFADAVDCAITLLDQGLLEEAKGVMEEVYVMADDTEELLIESGVTNV